MDAKAQLRQRMRAMRRSLSPEVRAHEAREVQRAVLDLVGDRPVFVFIGVRDELPTDGLIAALRERGPVAVPRITGQGTMEAAAWQEPLVDGPMRIPTSSGPVIDVVIALLPGLAFDAQGGRLGYGGGYYDRWLAAHPEVQAIGLGFTDQLIDAVPTERHDRPLDGVICGSRTVWAQT